MANIIKGTDAYKAAQDIANRIQGLAEHRRGSTFDSAFEKLGRFLSKIEDLNVFAAQVAKTVDNTMNCYGYKVASVSSKQAWVIACAAVEAGIEL